MMQFTTSSIAAILAFTSSAIASPLITRQSALKDFQVTDVGVTQPVGAFHTISASATDPNEINLGKGADGQDIIIPAGSQGIQCTARYFVRGGETPLGRTWACNPISDGFWAFEVLPGSDGQFSPKNFNVRFTHVAEIRF